MNEKTVRYVPNILTAMRVLLIPVFYYAFMHEGFILPKRYFAMLVFLMASLTDLFDGYIARKYNAVTSFGKVSDPFADKMLMMTALYCLHTVGVVGLWYVLVVGAKELLLIVGGFVMLRYKVVVESRFIGKAAAVALVAGVLAYFFDATQQISAYILYAALALTCAALVSYTMEGVLTMRKQRQKQELTE